jgi:hypothetical protein
MAMHRITLFVVLFVVLAGFAAAQAPQPPANTNAMPYGPPVTLETAKKAAAVALAEAAKNNWTMAAAVARTAKVIS